jgi:hypothetical protein
MDNRCADRDGLVTPAEIAAALDDVACDVRREQVAEMESLMRRLLFTDRIVRALEVDDERGSVLLTVGELTVRASVPAPQQWLEAEYAAALGILRLAATAPINDGQMMIGFRAAGIPILAVADTAVELG